MLIQTTNPSTGEVLNQYPTLMGDDVNARIQKGHACYLAWKKTSFAEREEKMLKLAKLLHEKKAIFASLMAQEVGKPVTAGIAEIEKCAWVCEHYAKHASSYLAPQLIESSMQKSFVCYQPMGIVFGIMPWNFPFWQVFRYAAPTLMAGNAAILKHAPISTGAAYAIEALFKEAGFPEHLFQTFVLDDAMAARVIAHEHVIAVTLTGSERAGSSVAAIGGQHIKRVVLELGGNDPYLVLADANLEHAARCLVKSRLNNTGQSCIAAKRIIVMNSVKEKLLALIMEEVKHYPMGDPMDATIKLGPIAREDLRETLHQQVLDTIQAGAICHLGGVLPKGSGFYYPVTVLSNVTPGMVAFEEEVFGPVISIIPVETEQEAIMLANQSQYGLGGGVFTQDLARGEWIATHAIETGSCMVNGFLSSDPRLPFGGIKHSGMGRELSKEGIREFVNIKTVGVSVLSES
jgi:succinate-semialdehyde dehydrogenase/glutarate-semialdehyde dehydrogenase